MLRARLYGIAALETASTLSRIDEVEDFIRPPFRHFLAGQRSEIADGRRP